MANEGVRKAATLSVENCRQWFGDQRFGAFQVALDDARVGVVLPGRRRDLPIEAGGHVLRIRQWWYRSQPLTLEVNPADDVRVGADISRSGGPLVRLRSTRGPMRKPESTGAAPLALAGVESLAGALAILLAAGHQDAPLRVAGFAALVTCGLLGLVRLVGRGSS